MNAIGDATEKKIMFVDDEVDVLNGIRGLFHRQRRVWSMRFVTGGQAAIDELARAPADVVVSDMRMPGVDGLALLTHVKQRHPAAVRIVLSGFTERAAALRLVPVAHRFLAKPCDAIVLERAISSACALHSLLHGERLADMAGRMTHLPSPPKVYREVLEVSGDPAAGLRDVADTIAKDGAVGAKILQIVNSAFFARARKIHDLRQATMLLGTATIRDLVLGIEATRGIQIEREHCGLDLEDEAQTARSVAWIARGVAQARGASTEESARAMTAGLLHGIGRLVMAVNDPAATKAIAHRSPGAMTLRRELELEVFGASSAELGAYLLALWGIPYPIVEGVAYQDCPSSLPGGFGAAAAVHVARIVHARREGVHMDVDEQFSQDLGIAADPDAWIREFEGMIEDEDAA